MGNNNNNVLALVIVCVALAVGLVFAVNYRQGTDFTNQPNQNQPWQNWNNSLNANPQQPGFRPPMAPMNPRSYQEAIDMSRRTGRRVLLFFHADWCTWCKKMESETLSDSRVRQALTQYIVYKVDTTRERAIGRKYLVAGIPAYCITDASERASQRGNGFKSPEEFLAWLNGQQRPNRPIIPDNRRPDNRPNPRPNPG